MRSNDEPGELTLELALTPFFTDGHPEVGSSKAGSMSCSPGRMPAGADIDQREHFVELISRGSSSHGARHWPLGRGFLGNPARSAHVASHGSAKKRHRPSLQSRKDEVDARASIGGLGLDRALKPLTTDH